MYKNYEHFTLQKDAADINISDEVNSDEYKIETEDLDDILKHDIWWNAKKCLSTGLVDKIQRSDKIYQFNEDYCEL